MSDKNKGMPILVEPPRLLVWQESFHPRSGSRTSSDLISRPGDEGFPASAFTFPSFWQFRWQTPTAAHGCCNSILITMPWRDPVDCLPITSTLMKIVSKAQSCMIVSAGDVTGILCLGETLAVVLNNNVHWGLKTTKWLYMYITSTLTNMAICAKLATECGFSIPFREQMFGSSDALIWTLINL